MVFEYLLPVSDKVLAFNALQVPQCLGNVIQIHSSQKGIPVLEGAQIAIIGVSDARNAFEKKTNPVDLESFRMEFYKLIVGNWKISMVDLGDVPVGDRVADTYFVFKEIVAELLQLGVVPVVIGATQDLTYPMYRSFDALETMVNMVSIDSRFDFGIGDELISSHSYMSKIISEQPTNLRSFVNLGYQSYFNTQEERDLMEKMFFDSYRLGEVAHNLSLSEPLFRNSHLVSVDCRAVRAAEMGGGKSYSPNGFTGREICALSRYAGMSDKVAVFGIFEGDNHHLSSQLTAQMIWYFLEGFGMRMHENPYTQKESFLKYTVTAQMGDLIFYKSLKTSRWWVDMNLSENSGNKSNIDALLPCTEQDYLAACQDEIPESWLKAQKKGFC